MQQPLLTTTSHHWTNDLLAEGCEPDEKLDQLVRDAAQLFKVPIAMINLVTADKLVFKACIGKTQADCLDRDGSFCDIAIQQAEPLMVVDATKDKNFKTYEHVTGEMHLRSYLGQSLHAPDGTKIATFCVLDTLPRKYTATQQQALSQLAALAEMQLAKILAYKLLSTNR